MKAVDVIVPIYGAADQVESCVESLLTNTTHSQARIVLADDASPYPEIGPLLDRFAEDDRVEVAVNDQNVGFVRNCNQAMKRSDKDVVLLNSDTHVGRGWLERLQSIAYTFDRVGSVTPLSNNAEVCSSPWWFEPNRYPDRVTISELDSVAADLAIEGPADLPTGVGFCLYLRRSALDAVGLFDEQAFGRGYGEENDLCARLRHAGYLNLLAPNVFVEHIGGASFSGTGTLSENLEVMSDRWPGYHTAVAEYRQADPLRGINSRFGLELAARGRDTNAIRPLYVLHYRTRIGRKGGTEHHTEDLIDGAGERLDPLILTFEDEKPVAQWDADGAGTSFPAATDAEDSASMSWIERLLDSGVDLIHVQHPKRIPLDALETLQARAETRGLAVVWSLHDYYTTCPCIQLVHPDGSKCPLEDHCQYCADLAVDEQSVGLREWKERYRILVKGADAHICPSETAASAQKGLLDLESAPSVIPHGIEGERTSLEPPPRTRPVMVVLGYNAPQKGGDLARELVRASGDRIEWVFLGRDHLYGLKPSQTVRFLGTYERAELPGMLRSLRPDGVALLSNWQETYLYTLSEAWRSGIPVFGTDIGAMSERINRQGGGVLIDPGDPQKAMKTIFGTLTDREMMDRLRTQATTAGESLPSIERTSDEYLAIYEELVGDRRMPANVSHTRPSVSEWRSWIGSFPAPFPTESAGPLRTPDPAH